MWARSEVEETDRAIRWSMLQELLLGKVLLGVTSRNRRWTEQRMLPGHNCFQCRRSRFITERAPDNPIGSSRANTVPFGSIIPLYYLVRKPTLILDFACTLTGLHALITIYYTRFRFPTSFFWWAVMALGTVLTIVGAEQVRCAHNSRQFLGMLICSIWMVKVVCSERDEGRARERRRSGFGEVGRSRILRIG